jgi:magnesium chelatase subunit I
MPEFMERVVGRVSQLARESGRVNQRSGVSVRLSVANHETLQAAALRRALQAGESEAVPRVSDLEALVASTLGKIEMESLDGDEDAEVVDKLLRQAVLQTYREICPTDGLGAVVGAFEDGSVVHAGPDLRSADYVEVLARIPALAPAVAALTGGSGGSESPAEVASAVELVLEGLHLSKRLNKDAAGARSTYRAR